MLERFPQRISHRVKLATLKDGTRDGRLAVVSRDLTRVCDAADIARTLQHALDNWPAAQPDLAERAAELEDGAIPSDPFEERECMAPLPRAYQWLDASAYLSHVERVRAARGATLPPDAATDPLMYQGDSDYVIGPRDPVEALSEEWGIDLEAELAVVLADVPMGTPAEEAGGAIRLLVLANDVSFRNLIPGELAKGFGFVNGKGATAFSPVAVTPDELGSAWNGRTLQRPLRVAINGRELGRPDAGRDVAFDFPRLIAHAVATRPLGAGTILGSGTISNQDTEAGYSCIAEIRAVETVRHGRPITPFLRFGDRVRIEMLDDAGRSIFGAIDQAVQRALVRRLTTIT
jgi:fumarylacetoacetate (FAA) hydrolase